MDPSKSNIKGLVTNNGEGGGLKNGREGACEILVTFFTPTKRGGAEKGFGGSFYVVSLKF